ncbi:membrane-associated tyrosine- and threonine-specific cdc2-inhibitory kinase [Drosophila sulfurigaster albostrigata]|uniref:membrane-associated tyrosine- and threonine-specific cdc2-inhibitory kinase n=1 Tax=Drosophila sulfurigaster albostrigata TaxID=89887 RepID=UPI002D21CE46|nr:membrane-associated tyrosine- and threonine-specific cdc2-inhibitory kinase [Drosophila sulfurigaster albostrigata]
MDKQRLPLPEMRDDKHRHKQFNGHLDSNRFRPPKYKTRYTIFDNNNLNRSQSLGSCSAANNSSQVAHAISFRSGSECPDAGILPASPNASTSMCCNESHFEQCFERLAKLGEGSFGEVFQVRDRSDSQMYAVKISKQLFRGEQYRAERLEEVRRYEEFSGHENCIRFIRAWEQYDRLFMQMELCRESLEQYLYRCRQIPEERIWHILLDLSRGLKSLHDRNLIHLDIKLDNVLIDDDDTCKLADFGLVIDVDKANNHQATEGDSRYMAPEILQGQFSKAADIFSLGIAMLELACYMDLPSNGQLWHELRQSKLPEEFINTISVELQQVIRTMMSPDPQLRPTADQLLAHPRLQRIQKEEKSMVTLKLLSKCFRRSRRAVWIKICNLKTAAYRCLFYILEFLHLYKPLTGSESSGCGNNAAAPSSPSSSMLGVPRVEFQLVGSTPIGNRDCYVSDFLSSIDNLELSQQGTPTACGREKLVNSTPLNHHHNKSARLRSCSARKAQAENSNLLAVDASNSRANLSAPKVLDSSSFLRKKLFLLDSDEE